MPRFAGRFYMDWGLISRARRRDSATSILSAKGPLTCDMVGAAASCSTGHPEELRLPHSHMKWKICDLRTLQPVVESNLVVEALHRKPCQRRSRHLQGRAGPHGAGVGPGIGRIRVTINDILVRQPCLGICPLRSEIPPREWPWGRA